jgi:Fe2+ or Zn2+ uptake regulation protein
MTQTTASYTATRNQRLTKQNLDLMNYVQEQRDLILQLQKLTDELKKERDYYKNLADYWHSNSY